MRRWKLISLDWYRVEQYKSINISRSYSHEHFKHTLKYRLRPCLHGVLFCVPQSVKAKETNPTRPGYPTPCKQALKFWWVIPLQPWLSDKFLCLPLKIVSLEVRRHSVNRARKDSFFAKSRAVNFDLPHHLTPGQDRFQQFSIPHPWVQRAGLVPRVARGDGIRSNWTMHNVPCDRKWERGVKLDWDTETPELLHISYLP